MPSAPYNPRGEEKLKLILGQLSALRARINGLALQQSIFAGLALLITTTAIIVMAAFSLAPLAFLSVGITAAASCAVGLLFAGRHLWRMRKSPDAVAALADERAELKDRILTLVAMQRREGHSSLWPYLIEDATLKREEFAPARIQRRRISRTLYLLIVSIALAALVTPVTHHARRPIALAKRSESPLTLNLRDLTIEPSNRQSGNSARLSGDPKTMRKLAQMMAAAQRKERNKDLLSRMKRSAQDLAGNLQDKITGRQAPPLDIRLADNGGPASNPANPPADQSMTPPPDAENQPPADSGNPGSSAQAPAHGSTETAPGGNQSPLAMAAPPNTPDKGLPQSGADSRPFADERAGSNDAGGASHGAGTDPKGLFGPPENDNKSQGSFQIAIDARPGSAGRAANRAYPPKVNAPLNPEQYADEPIGRTDVPAEDRSTIKRIFER